MHIHPKPIADEPVAQKKSIGEIAGKWMELGHHQVICDVNGKIEAHIYVGPSTQPSAPIPACIGNKEIGRYVSAAAARKAVNRVRMGHDDEGGTLLTSMLKRFQRMREESADVTPTARIASDKNEINAMSDTGRKDG